MFIRGLIIGEMGQATLYRISDIGVPCVHDEFILKRLLHHLTSTILDIALEQKTNLRWLHRVSKYRQVFHHQYPSQKESMQNCPYRRREKSVAIYYPHETDLSHRLSWDYDARRR